MLESTKGREKKKKYFSSRNWVWIQDLKCWTVADRVPRSFKGPFLKKDILFYIPTTSCQAAHVLNSIKVCSWPISLTMSLGKYLTSSPLQVPRGLWLRGRLQHQNSEVSIITCKFLSMQQAQRQRCEKKSVRLLWVLTSLCFPVTSVKTAGLSRLVK